MIIHIPGFAGQAPRISKQKLKDNQGQIARDCDLFSGDLRPARSYKQIQKTTLTDTVLSIYKLGIYWLEWAEDVDVVPSPLALGQDQRIYYTGHRVPKVADLTTVANPSALDRYYSLAYPTPESVLNVTDDFSGSAGFVTLSYTYTWVSQWGEESAPAPVTTITAHKDSIWTIDLTVGALEPLDSQGVTVATPGAGIVTIAFPKPHLFQSGEYVWFSGFTGLTDLNQVSDEAWEVTRLSATQLTVPVSSLQPPDSSGTVHREAKIVPLATNKYRIYRTDTVTGEYKLLAETATFPINETPQDTDTNGLLGELLPGGVGGDEQWLRPRIDLQGLTALPFGSLAGFTENTLCFSEPYAPYAWPRQYELSFPFPIVSLGTFGHNIVVTTTGRPYIVTGTHPESMGQADLEINQACVSKRGTGSFVNGVVYPSPDGLVYVPGAGRPQLITQSWMKKQDWAKYKPGDLNAEIFDGRYYGFYTDGGDTGAERGAFVFDPSEIEASFITLADYATAGYVELESDTMYLMIDGNIVQWVAGGGFRTYQWFSKRFIVKRPMAPKVAQVRSEVLEGISIEEYQAALDAAVAALEDDITNDIVWNNGGFGGFVPAQYTVAGGPFLGLFNLLPKQGVERDEIFRLYADGVLKVERQVSSSQPFRLHAGYRTQEIEVEVTGSTAAIQSITVAETPAELSAI